jgi:hypothetical protein
MPHRVLVPLLVAYSITSTSLAHADDVVSAAKPWRLSIDTDPSTFAFNGFSAWVMTKPRGTEHLRLGVGTFGLEFPSFLVPTLNRGSEDGWDLTARAVMAFGGYMFGDRKGFYVGSYAGYLQSRHERDDMPGVAVRHNITVLPTAGYQWFPFSTGALRGAYVQPWVGATIWFPVGGTSSLGTHEFKDPHVIPLAALHLGYEF